MILSEKYTIKRLFFNFSKFLRKFEVGIFSSIFYHANYMKSMDLPPESPKPPPLWKVPFDGPSSFDIVKGFADAFKPRSPGAV